MLLPFCKRELYQSRTSDLNSRILFHIKLVVHLYFFRVSGGSVVYEGCYGQGAEQLPALVTGGGRPAQKESRNYKEPQDLNTITNPK